jgi:archaellum biogenesis ATPase FlaH
VQTRYWDSKRVSLLKGTFDEFVRTLDKLIDATFRGVAKPQAPEIPLSERFGKKDSNPSEICTQFLTLDAIYVKSATSTENVPPTQFYKGFSPGWSAIAQNLDVKRDLTDTVLTDYFLSEESAHGETMELVVLKGHAGAGKSVLLRRIAWDAAHDYNCLCLYMNRSGVINSSAIQEIINLCDERVYLFVDDIADRVREIESLASSLGPEARRLTVIAAERINEWNVACESLSPLVTEEYELQYLSPREIDDLLKLLEQHRALFTLERHNIDERRQAFEQRAGRQLLVALHEATLGKPFEEIIKDEYDNITPDAAKRIYLTICVLNRLNVPVRAGIISRSHGVPFERFCEEFFQPLDHIVVTDFDAIIRDYTYSARHPHIAEIVFEQVLTNSSDRYDAYLRCLRALNVDYRSDRFAFRQMVRGRTLLNMFPDHEMVKSLFAAAREQAGETPHLLQQMAIYEMHRPNGNLTEAADLLNRAFSIPWLNSV